MKILERERQYPEVFLHRALSSHLVASGWQVREEVKYLTKRFDIVAYQSGLLICFEVKTRDYRGAIAQLATSRLIFHKVFVGLGEHYANRKVIRECDEVRCGLVAIGAPPQFRATVLNVPPWCEERVDQHTFQVMRIANFKSA